MGFLKRFFRSRAAVQQLPTGSLTVDRNGEVVTNHRLLRVSGARCCATSRCTRCWVLFREARAWRQMPMAEVSLHFDS